MFQEIVLGNAVEAAASQTNGWVVGHFIPEGLGHTNDFEIKIWHYDSQPNYPPKILGGTEFIIVEKGTLVLELEIPDGQGGFIPRRIELKSSIRDYIIIPPGCKKRVVVAEAPSLGITVRWPSAPGILE